MNMLKMKTFLATAVMALGLCGTASAQSAADKLDYKPAPYMFIGLQGGVQATYAEVSLSKLVTPTASFSLGAFLTPAVGVRLNVNGMWNKSGLEIAGQPDFKYKYKYVNTNIDLLLNLSTMLGKEDYYRMNVYLIAGIGLNYAWENKDLINSGYASPFAWKDDQLSHNARIGAMLDYNLSKHWSANLEVSANALSDRYNSQRHSSEDWQFIAQVGLAYKFGFSKKVHTAPIVVAPIEEYNDDKNAEAAHARMLAEQAARRKAAEEAAARAALAAETTQKDIFFTIGSAEIRESEAPKIQEVVEWLQGHPDAVATITGHADAGTGNPTVNARHAKNRAENVAKAIVDAGIDATRLTVESKGDTVMPYGDNEKSRVAIVLAGTPKQ